MNLEVKLPRLAETVDEFVVISWLVAVGSSIVEGAPLMVIETDKIEVELPSPTTGTVTELLVAEGDEVTTGQSVCVIDAIATVP